jgi:DNA helicase II / ATP-dependent DNA helicase PcrA
MNIPQLDGEALAAALHRDGHLQIIAAAGSGKTELVSQRVALLVAEGVPAESIVAFTFTERAAKELKHRIAARVGHIAGPVALGSLGAMFVGTIHGYCFRMLQTHLSRYETFDVVDPHQLTAFLVREATQLDIKKLDDRNRTYGSIKAFQESVDVVENELIDPNSVGGDFGDVLRSYLESLSKYRLLTFGQLTAHAVAALAEPTVAHRVHEKLRHLIVDEYQDVNPAQEELIRLLTSGGAQLCVVGDDDQAIYQWRGSKLANIVTFSDRYSAVASFRIETNRRSRPTIIDTANSFASTIPGRLPKAMRTFRNASAAQEVVVWGETSEHDEAGYITSLIDALTRQGFDFRDIAILVRSRASYPQILEQLAAFGVPVQPGGRSGLFDQPEAQVIGKVFVWLADADWRRRYEGPGEKIELETLLDEFQTTFNVDRTTRAGLREFLLRAKKLVPQENNPRDLLKFFYMVLDHLSVRSWDLSDPLQANRLGTLARFSALLADYESMRRRARPDPNTPGEQVGGMDRGRWYFLNLATHIVNYAADVYRDFEGEDGVGVDAVDLLTIHSAKGLEWPAVFVPSLTANRFPSKKTGWVQTWLLPRDQFNAARYEGSDADERRLLYVAMTRARDWLSLSHHERVGDGEGRKQQQPSPYLDGFSHLRVSPNDIEVPTTQQRSAGESDVALSFSELSQYLECGTQYRLRALIGFQPRLAPELGYGKAVHHVLRRVADWTGTHGEPPALDAIEAMIHNDFFLPAANKPQHANLKQSARKLIGDYVADHADDLKRVWEVERPFELRLDGVTVAGRADVILDREDGRAGRLAILDYKTSTEVSPEEQARHQLQLQVYAAAGHREGLEVAAGYVHDLKAGARTSVDVSEDARQVAEETVVTAAVRLRNRDFSASPETKKCRACEVRAVCSSRA